AVVCTVAVFRIWQEGGCGLWLQRLRVVTHFHVRTGTQACMAVDHHLVTRADAVDNFHPTLLATAGLHFIALRDAVFHGVGKTAGAFGQHRLFRNHQRRALAGAQVELQELSRTQQAFAVVDVGLDGNGTIDRIDTRINARQFTDETLVAVAGTGDFHFLPGRQLAEVFFRYREHHL